MLDQSHLMLSTQRLRFDAWRADDIDLLFDLHVDPLVQRAYAPGPEKWTRQGIQKRLDGYMGEQSQFGFTKWKLSLSDGTFIGRAGWSPREKGELELGYAIKPQFWNNGYASEAAHALVKWGQHHRPENILVGFALPNNSASLRILEKIGMVYLDDREIAGAMFAFYELKA